MTRRKATGTSRGQSNVIGVALLLGVTVLSLGTLTAGIGAVVQDNAATADARRVADGLDSALRPVEATGTHHGRVSFAEGRLHTVEREFRLLNDTGTVRRLQVGGLVFERQERRVAFVAGTLTRGPPGSETLVESPPVTVGPDVLVVGVPRLEGRVAVSGSNAEVTLRTNVSHDRVRLGNGTYRVAVETAAPDALARGFERRGATVTRRDFDDDGVQSVVARFPRERRGYLVVHDVTLGVGDG